MGSLKGNYFAYSDTTLKLYRTQDSGADSTYIFESVNVEFHELNFFFLQKFCLVFDNSLSVKMKR